jgi:putative acetyltransferase
LNIDNKIFEFDVEIRTERASDYDEVFQLNYLAFGNREYESRLIERIRLSDQFIPELSIVAEANQQIVGHALFSNAKVVDGKISHDVLVLAPIAVIPSHQGRGIGSKLIQVGLKRCTELGYDFVFLVGHPTYYPIFGFNPAKKNGFELKQYNVSDEVFMVRELKEGMTKKIKGELRYPKSFFV